MVHAFNKSGNNSISGFDQSASLFCGVDHVVWRTTDSSDPGKIVERIDTVARVVFHSQSHIDHVEILGKLDAPATIPVGVYPLDDRLAIPPAEDKARGIYFEPFGLHDSVSFRLWFVG